MNKKERDRISKKLTEILERTDIDFVNMDKEELTKWIKKISTSDSEP